MRTTDHERVVAVVVAYNRASLLTAALDALGAQTRPVDQVVVIDNASQDDSAHVARAHPVGADVWTSARNTGGAGGFAIGIARAVVEHDADLVWVMDDDTVPTTTALAELLIARQTFPGPTAALASRVVWTDGRDHPMNTPRPWPFARRSLVHRARAVGAVPVRSMSFVSMLIDAREVVRVGLPVADYFIWNDDFEYSARILRRRVGLYVPASVVEHRTAAFAGADSDPGARFVFEVRNKVWLLTRSGALGPGERLLFAAATVRRWARTFLRSKARRTLVRAGADGARQALARGPRANTEALGGLGEASAWVAAVEGKPRIRPISEVEDRFSVLLPVYRGDQVEHLERSFRSVTQEQTRGPDQVVIVQDGPVRPAVARFLESVAERADTTVVRLPENRGLARALEVGLAACRYEIVARADADDISLPRRFETQVPLVRDQFDVVGSAIQEFEDETRPGMVRLPPVEQDAIARYARFLDPFNHPSVVFRRSTVRAAGGYEHLPLMEDYLLFARLIAHGARVANVAEPLVLYRVGAGAYARRGGWALLRSEISLQRVLHTEGFTTRTQMARNLAVRGGYRLVPEGLRRRTYRAFVIRRGQRQPVSARTEGLR